MITASTTGPSVTVSPSGITVIIPANLLASQSFIIHTGDDIAGNFIIQIARIDDDAPATSEAILSAIDAVLTEQDAGLAGMVYEGLPEGTME